MSNRPPDTDPEGHATPDPTVPIDSLATPGSSLGPFLLRERIGSGGMGEVWKAEQASPVRRTVALKLIKAGMDSREALARFEAERQALALMDHPCIAKVFDAGTTPQGRPWFAMEYVRGIPITEYCDKHRLSTADRLQLFQRVCEGVQHAHQKAVLHRDLKPGNILVADVDEKPLPKIIDFGVAKATTQKLTEKTMYTAMGQLIGTPEYMSPEQAELTGEDVDTRTDVYSLGVILYELLVGALPFESKELRKAGFEGIRKMIREQDPPRPSTKLSTLGDQTTEIATHRRTGPKRLSSQLKGDLDWIVMRCLEKDRNRRYGSPQELAQDLERHLKDEPVLAGPPSAGYRTRKFVRRNRLGVSVVAAALIVLVAFTSMTLVQSRRIAAERNRANREAEASERVTAFLAEMLASVDPDRLGNALVQDLRSRVASAREQRGATDAEVEAALASFDSAMSGVNRADAARHLLDVEILDRAAKSIDSDLEAQPLIAARLHQTLSMTYRQLGLHDAAEPHITRALEIGRELLGQEARETLSSLHERTLVLHAQGKIKEATESGASALEARTRLLGLEDPETLESLETMGDLEHASMNYTTSDSLHRLTLELRQRGLGPDDPATLQSMASVADHHKHMRRETQADSLFVVTLEACRRVLGDEHDQTLGVMDDMALFYSDRGEHEKEEHLLRQVAETKERVLGSEHPATIYAKMRWASSLRKLGRIEEWDHLSQDVIRTSRYVFGPAHSRTIYYLDIRARQLYLAGRTDQSARLYEETLRLEQRLPEGDDRNRGIASTQYFYSEVLRARGEHVRAAKLLEECAEYYKREWGPENARTLDSIHFAAVSYHLGGQFAEAESIYVELLALRRQAQGETHPRTLGTIWRLANLYSETDRLDDAYDRYSEFMEGYRALAEDPSAGPAQKNLYASLLLGADGSNIPEELQDFENGLAMAIQANELLESPNPDYLDTLALAYYRNGQVTKAVGTQRRALSMMTAEDPDRPEYEGRLKEFESALTASNRR